MATCLDACGASVNRSLSEQLDEVQLLEAMVGRDGEFEWRQEEESGRISGRLQVFLQLDQELVVHVAKRERYTANYRRIFIKKYSVYVCVCTCMCAERPRSLLHLTPTLTHQSQKLQEPPLPVTLFPLVCVCHTFHQSVCTLNSPLAIHRATSHTLPYHVAGSTSHR